MIITSEQAKGKSEEVLSICSMCKKRSHCKDYLASVNMSKHGFSVTITECPNFEKE